MKILLVPTTEVILTHKDRDSGSPLIDLVSTDEFLASHVLSVGDSRLSEENKDPGSVRDSRGKAKQFSTLNGRTVVIKESFVYSNKGMGDVRISQRTLEADKILEAFGISIKPSFYRMSCTILIASSRNNG